MKILTTQLTGLFQRIAQSEEDAIEETARLLAQATVGQGKVYFACFDGLETVELNALNSSEPFYKLEKWTTETEITDVDRVCIFTKSSQNEAAINLAKKLYEKFIPFAVIASEPPSDTNELSELAYTYISMKIRGGILPHPTKLGERTLIPHLLSALYIYEAVKLSYDEFITDDDELS